MKHNALVVPDTTPDLHELFVLFSRLKLLESSQCLKITNIYINSYHKYFTISAKCCIIQRRRY